MVDVSYQLIGIVTGQGHSLLKIGFYFIVCYLIIFIESERYG
jgi:hypothetical protein